MQSESSGSLVRNTLEQMDQIQQLAVSARTQKDIETFEKVLTELPQNSVRQFTNNLFGEAYLTKYDLAMVENFEEYSSDLTTTFFNEQIRTNFEDIKITLRNLSDFLENRVCTKGNDNIFYFHPELKGDQSATKLEEWLGKNLTNDEVWHKEKATMDSLTMIFLDNYQTFIKYGRDALFTVTASTEIIPADVINNKTPKTEANKNKGWLLFHGQKILIGASSTGKFKLVEILCDNFGKAKTIDTVFNVIKVKKDKNKIDNSLSNAYTGDKRRLQLIQNQMKEVGRAINRHVKGKKITVFNFRLALKDDGKNVWLEETVG